MHNYTEYYSLGLEFIEAAALLSSQSNDTDVRQKVVAHILHHGCELFLKFAILSKTKQEEIRGHQIEKLLEIYEELYPTPEFALNLPFDFRATAIEVSDSDKSLPENQMMQNHLEQYPIKKMGEHLRYPSGKTTGGYSFSFDTSFFDDLKATLKDIGDKILIEHLQEINKVVTN